MIMSSYKPVNLLGTLSNITECAVQVQLLKQLEDMGQIQDNHHAHQGMLSTSTALLQISDFIDKTMDEKRINQTMAMDPSFTFNCIDHRILIVKLQMYRISRETIEWIASYLEYQTQFIIVRRHSSRIIPVVSVVPQGTILGPLIDLVYINEFPESIRKAGYPDPSHGEKMMLFGADCDKCGHLPVYVNDETYVVTNKDRESNERMAIERLEMIKKFFTCNKIVINVTKTSLMEYMLKL